MAEAQGNRQPQKVTQKESIGQPPQAVSLDETHMGYQSREPNAAFSLSVMFPRDANADRSSLPSRVYFRTNSGNIYMFDSQGNFCEPANSYFEPLITYFHSIIHVYQSQE